MAIRIRTREEARRRRHRRVRSRVFGTAERPRLSVFRSHKHTYAQIIRDDTGETLAAASTLDPALREAGSSGAEGARAVGKRIAERATAAGIASVVLDRGGYRFHGRVRELAEAAREAGLNF